MKRFISLFLLFLVAISVAACGSKSFTVQIGEGIVLQDQELDLTKVKKDTVIKFTLNEEYEGAIVKANNKVVNHDNNGVFSVKITVNTTITAYKDSEDVTDFDGRGQEFVIMVDSATTFDPRNSQYAGSYKEILVEKIAQVEQKYNIKVVYQTYPGSASWGGARERYIVERASQPNPSHIYQIISTSVPALAQLKVILPLNDLIDTFAKNIKQWPIKDGFTSFNGKQYAFDSGYPLSEEGLFYNKDILAQHLGESRKSEPIEMWKAGNWTWDAFESLVNELNTKMTGENEYVLGGRTYNWAYQMIAANGGVLVSPDLKTHVTSEPVLEALDFLNRLYGKTNMWFDQVPLENASAAGFKEGKIAFHNGQSYWAYMSSKWNSEITNLGYVPYPKGPRIKDDLSNYYINSVYGGAMYVISSSYSKEKIPAGYENSMFHDEIIFQIWRDLLYFPPTDPNTGYPEIEDMKMEYYLKRMQPYYQDALEHIKIADKIVNELFYIVPEASGHVEDSYMIKIQLAITDGDIRNIMTAMENELRATLIEKFDLPSDFYDN